MQADKPAKMIKRLNTTLPDPLALYVGMVTGKGGDYETPSEFIRDLVRRHMEKSQEREDQEIRIMIERSIAEDDYSPWTEKDIQEARSLLED